MKRAIELTDPRALRALAHPLRVKLLGLSPPRGADDRLRGRAARRRELRERVVPPSPARAVRARGGGGGRNRPSSGPGGRPRSTPRGRTSQTPRSSRRRREPSSASSSPRYVERLERWIDGAARSRWTGRRRRSSATACSTSRSTSWRASATRSRRSPTRTSRRGSGQLSCARPGHAARGVPADRVPRGRPVTRHSPTPPGAAGGRVPRLLRESTVFRRYWGAHTVSLFGDQVSMLALPLVAVLAARRERGRDGVPDGARARAEPALRPARGRVGRSVGPAAPDDDRRRPRSGGAARERSPRLRRSTR